MTRTQYAHHVIKEFLSVSVTCIFAMENYQQATSLDGNNVLRKQFNECMAEYESIYANCQSWSPSTEDLIDYETVMHLRREAEDAAGRFVSEFEKLLRMKGISTYDVKGEWTKLRSTRKEGESLSSQILQLVKNLRTWEEANI